MFSNGCSSFLVPELLKKKSREIGAKIVTLLLFYVWNICLIPRSYDSDNQRWGYQLSFQLSFALISLFVIFRLWLYQGTQPVLFSLSPSRLFLYSRLFLLLSLLLRLFLSSPPGGLVTHFSFFRYSSRNLVCRFCYRACLLVSCVASRRSFSMGSR